MAPGYGINSIGYANDPYFMYALNSYNPNFMAAQQTQTTQTQTQVQNTQTTNPSFQGGTQNQPKADYSEKSNAGTIIGAVTIAAGAVALINAGRKGKLDGIKKFLGFGTKNINNATNEAAKKITENFTVKYNKSGKLLYKIPVKTTTVKGINNVEKYAKDNGIKLNDLLKFSNENSVITGGKYVVEQGGKKYYVKFSEGKIFDIIENKKSIKNLLESTNVDDIKLVEKLNEKLAQITSMEGKWAKNLEEITYKTQIGDDILSVTKAVGGSAKNKPTNIDLTTLERFSADSEAVKAYMHDNSSAAVFLSKELKMKITEGF